MLKVLVVEDDFHIRNSMREILEEESFEVVTACNGLEALAVLESGREPDVIVLDLIMPLLSGWEFLQELRAHERGSYMPVVICSVLVALPPGGRYDRKLWIDVS